MPLKPFNKIIFKNIDLPELPVIMVDSSGRRHQADFSTGKEIVLNVERTSEGHFFKTEQKVGGESLILKKLDINGGASADDFVFNSNGKIHYWAKSFWIWYRTEVANAKTGTFEGQVFDSDGINKHPSAYLQQSVQDQTLTIAFSSEEHPVVLPVAVDSPSASDHVDAAA